MLADGMMNGGRLKYSRTFVVLSREVGTRKRS